MGKPIAIALVGISGYGGTHVNRLLDKPDDQDIQLVAAIDPYPDRCRRLQELKEAGARLYSSLEEFYSSGGEADLAIISSPIHFHARHTITALENGSNVLCEKPAAATIQDAFNMAATAAAAEKFVAIGYQWSFSDAIQELKKDISSGLFGRPISLKSFISWPRPESYYRDRHWAAKVKSEEGEWILDSPVHNATAHYLHNCLYVLGEHTGTSAAPAEVQAELYRANSIENYDTAALRIYTKSGIDILHYVSHAVPSDIGPVVSYSFEHATIIHERLGSNRFIARFLDGRIKDYGSPDDGGAGKCWKTVDAIRKGERPLCDIWAAIPQVICTNGAQESMEVANFPSDLVRKQGSQENPLTYVNGLQAVLLQCFNLGILPQEHGGISWARKSKEIRLDGYIQYPSKP